MSLQRRPHTVTVKSFDQTVTAGTLAVAVPSYAAGTLVPGFLQPQSFGTVFDAAGNAISRPHVLLINTADAGSFDLNYRVTYSGRTFQVRCKPEIRSAGSGADYALVQLEELEAT